MSRPPSPSPDPAYRVALADYERLVATMPGVERKGAAVPYTSAGGHMFSYLHPSGRLALRLPPGMREDFLGTFATTLFEAYGVIQKEYVTVPAGLLADTAALGEYFRAGFDHVRAMKPKPAKGKG